MGRMHAHICTPVLSAVLATLHRALSAVHLRVAQHFPVLGGVPLCPCLCEIIRPSLARDTIVSTAQHCET